jgi:hypothetical protein
MCKAGSTHRRCSRALWAHTGCTAGQQQVGDMYQHRFPIKQMPTLLLCLHASSMTCWRLRLMCGECLSTAATVTKPLWLCTHPACLPGLPKALHVHAAWKQPAWVVTTKCHSITVSTMFKAHPQGSGSGSMAYGSCQTLANQVPLSCSSKQL